MSSIREDVPPEDVLSIPVEDDIPIVPIIAGELVSDVKMLSSQHDLTTTRGPTKFNEEQIQKLLLDGYTSGLIKAIEENFHTFPLRVWIVDNSGSMSRDDGTKFTRVSEDSNQYKAIPCTRWNELQESVEYHANIAALLNAPTEFRLLNHPGSHIGPQEFSIAVTGNEEEIESDLQIAQNVIWKASPKGMTPLTPHLKVIRDRVRLLAPQYEADGHKVAVIIATDGLPTDERGKGGQYAQREFIKTLKSLESLPIWIVIRLCTNRADVIKFYNSLDSQLELSIEVLLNFPFEAKELYIQNKWLNYALPLHRMREMGFHNRLFDLIDERRLRTGELRDYCMFIFGKEKYDGSPNPEVAFRAFRKHISKVLKTEKTYWNPMKRVEKPLLDLKKVSKAYDDSCTVM